MDECLINIRHSQKLHVWRKFYIFRHIFLGQNDFRKSKSYSFLDSVRAGSFTVPGDGDFDFTPVFDVLDEAGYEGWVVVEAEQDPAIANPYEYAVLARNYIREKTGL